MGIGKPAMTKTGAPCKFFFLSSFFFVLNNVLRLHYELRVRLGIGKPAMTKTGALCKFFFSLFFIVLLTNVLQVKFYCTNQVGKREAGDDKNGRPM